MEKGHFSDWIEKRSNGMRVIGGKYKGQIIRLPGNIKIRPTKDMVKQALFNILGKQIQGATFLELFAGSGNIGIEALSRGADRVFLVENNRACIKATESNLKRLKLLYNFGLKSQSAKKKANVTLLPVDVEKAIEMLYRRKEKFDFVFLDPPYHQENRSAITSKRFSQWYPIYFPIPQNELKNTLIKIDLYDILRPRSYVIVEHYKTEILPQRLARLEFKFTRKYGEAALSFYQQGS